MEYENSVIHFNNANDYFADEMRIDNKQPLCVSDDDCEIITVHKYIKVYNSAKNYLSYQIDIAICNIIFHTYFIFPQ